jgi:hypothetical protein
MVHELDTLIGRAIHVGNSELVLTLTAKAPVTRIVE